MLPAQIANVAECALGTPPPTRDFLDRLVQNQEPEEAPGELALFGNAFPDEERPGLPDGTVKSQQSALRAVPDFQKVLESQGQDLQNLDEWLATFAMWTPSPKFLMDDEEAQKRFLEQRKQFCQQAHVSIRD